MKPPPLPDLTALSREQLVDCCHRLNASLVQCFSLVETLEERIALFERRTKAVPQSSTDRSEGNG